MHTQQFKRKTKLILNTFLIILFGIEPFLDANLTVHATNLLRAQDMVIDTAVYDLNHVVVIKKGQKRPKLLPVRNSYTTQSVSNQVSFQERESKKQILTSKIALLLSDPDYELVQPNYIYSTSAWTTDTSVAPYKAYPNDYDMNSGSPATGKHWYYTKSRLPELWYLQGCHTGSSNCGGTNTVTVAVIDTGLAYENRDNTTATYSLSDKKWIYHANTDMFGAQSINLYTNAGETPNNGIDDDNNGYIDDYNGFDATAYAICNDGLRVGVTCTAGNADFAKEVGRPNDDFGHGTYVTGMIASVLDNYDAGDLGSISPNTKIKIMPIKANNYRTGDISSVTIFESLTYAIEHNANVINMSFGGNSTLDNLIYSKLQAANTAGIILVAASGNSAATTPTPPGYPANYPEVIAVGSANRDGTRSAYSQYGAELDLVAYIGDNTGTAPNYAWQKTITCLGNNTCATTTDFVLSAQGGLGTSYAAPQVAGLAALLKSGKPSATSLDIKNVLYSTAIDLGTTGRDDQTGYGAIDYYFAYKTLVLNDPPTITVAKKAGYADLIHKKFAVTWAAADSDSNADINIYYNTDNTSNVGTLINTCGTVKENTTPNGECAFSTVSIPSGNYSIFGCINDGYNTKVCDHIEPSITINHTNIECGPLDSNTDNTINITDFIDFAVSYNKTCTDNPASYTSSCGAKDRNANNILNINDFIYFTSKYNSSCI